VLQGGGVSESHHPMIGGEKMNSKIHLPCIYLNCVGETCQNKGHNRHFFWRKKLQKEEKSAKQTKRKNNRIILMMMPLPYWQFCTYNQVLN